MGDTPESIRLSGSQDELTYICAHDLSMVYDMLPACDDLKKNLEPEFEDERIESSRTGSSIPFLSVLGDTMKVYLRLRPVAQETKLTQQQQEAYRILDATTLLTKLPSLDRNSNSLKRPKGSETVSHKFNFTHIFGPVTTQLELFEQTTKQLMAGFLNGRSATVMCYGTTNAGKTFTLQGTTDSPGIIPRSLEFVFGNIGPKPTSSYKPLNDTDVVSLDANCQACETELKTKLLSFGSTSKKYIQAYKSMQQLLRAESPPEPINKSDANYSVWVSFAEIYNETIYDLLSNDCHKKRPALKLGTDRSGKKVFIKDLKMVCVNSSSEAYQFFMLGQQNLNFAATALNARSSRSHCIFTIKLIKYRKEDLPSRVQVSTFSFCDLAGTERLKKTLNAGDRLKEARNINTSLLVLGRCLKSIFEVQSSRTKLEIVGPFRESKLTRLFQAALSGKEHIALIVNVNPEPHLYYESQNVLKFSAIAKQIVIEPVVKVKRRASRTRFSQIVAQSVDTVTDWDVQHLKSIGEEKSCSNTDKAEYVHIHEHEEILRENSKLKKRILELENSELSNRKRRRIDVGETRNYDLSNADSKVEIARLNSKVDSLLQSLKEMRESNKKIIIEKNKIDFELSLTKKKLANLESLHRAARSSMSCDSHGKGIMREQEKQLIARDKQIKMLKSYLNEAKTDYLALNRRYEASEASNAKKYAELAANAEKIADLSVQIEEANICLAESTRIIEDLDRE